MKARQVIACHTYPSVRGVFDLDLSELGKEFATPAQGLGPGAWPCQRLRVANDATPFGISAKRRHRCLRIQLPWLPGRMARRCSGVSGDVATWKNRKTTCSPRSSGTISAYRYSSNEDGSGKHVAANGSQTPYAVLARDANRAACEDAGSACDRRCGQTADICQGLDRSGAKIEQAQREDFGARPASGFTGLEDVNGCAEFLTVPCALPYQQCRSCPRRNGGCQRALLRTEYHASRRDRKRCPGMCATGPPCVSQIGAELLLNRRWHYPESGIDHAPPAAPVSDFDQFQNDCIHASFGQNASRSTGVSFC